jgi:hypothetical protein
LLNKYYIIDINYQILNGFMSKKSTPIPGLSFSWKRAVGLSQAKQKLARETGIPMSKSGLERKIGSTILKMLFKSK